MLMAVKAPDRKNLILLVDCSWSGASFSFVFPAKYHITVQEFVEYLPKYLQHAHGDAVFWWFTPDAIVEAKEMGWDDHLNQPISQDGIDLKADLKLMDFDWCIPTEEPSKIKLANDTPVDMDNLLLPSFQMLGNKGTLLHPAGPSMTVVDSMTSHSKPPLSFAMTVTLEDLTTNSTIASHLSALETNWNLILQCLDKLVAMGPPPTSSGPVSTSTLPDHSTPGAAMADLGTRV